MKQKRPITIDGIIINKWTPLMIDESKLDFHTKAQHEVEYEKWVREHLSMTGTARVLNTRTCYLHMEDDTTVVVNTSWLKVAKDKMMKTELPLYIKTVPQAKKLLIELHSNNESYHPEDDANDIWYNGKKLFTHGEAVQLNKLMDDIYSLPGQQGSLAKVFCPCEFLINLDKKAVSLRQVNKALKEVHPNIELIKGEGYFYISSDDDKTALMLAGLHTTSIPVYSITQQTTQQWINDVTNLLKK